jgi:hypothetical protein
MRLRIVLVVIVGAMSLGPAALASTFPDLPGMSAADRVVGGRTPSSLSTDGAQAKKASAPVSTSASDQRTSSTLPDTKSIRDMPGGTLLPAISKLHVGFASARHAAGTPLGLMMLAAFVVVGFTRLLYALNRV